MHNVKALLIFLSIVFSTQSYANENCNSPNHRAFDFWLGNWQVTTNADTIILHNSITIVNRGCTLLEQYSTPSGYVGKSLNIYDQQSQQWHQTWTDNNGLLLKLSGNIIKKSMVMTGETIDKDKNTILNKITWTPNPNGTVRQHWQISKNKGKSWRSIFDGLYTKK